MKQLRLLILFFGAFNSVLAKPISENDIVIVVLTAEDISLSFSTEAAAWRKRKLFAPKTAEFIRYAGAHAKSLLVDNFFPKYQKKDDDDLIIDALKSSKNITLAASGFNLGESYMTRTDKAYLTAVKEVGHIGLYDGTPEGFQSPDGRGYFQFNGYLCADGYKEYIYPTECQPAHLDRHIALIAAELFTGRNMRPHIETSVWIPKGKFKRFKILTVKEFESNKSIIHDKMVLFQKRPVPSVDLHPMGDGTNIYGIELLANLILYFANEHNPP